MNPTLIHLLKDLASRPVDPSFVARDPVRFLRRYEDRADREVVGALASSLAFGRVALFGPVVEGVLDLADAAGGPAAWFAALDPRDAAPFVSLGYRWVRPTDLAIWLAALGRVRAERSLESVFGGDDPDPSAAAAIQRGVTTFRAACAVAAGVPTFADLPRGVRVLLPTPSDGSACKRWCMFLRWMVRPDDGIDLGLWSRPRPSRLVVPLDVHVARISRLIGLTDRTDASWRTAAAVTARLAALDPDDPTRFDFALAHLGISEGCTGWNDAAVCPACSLRDVCRRPEPVGRVGSSRSSRG